MFNQEKEQEEQGEKSLVEVLITYMNGDNATSKERFVCGRMIDLLINEEE